MTIKPTHQIAYDYAQAIMIQRSYETQLDRVLKSINPDNQVFGLADPIEGQYTKLVQTLLSEQLFDWLMWWIYETEMGTKDMEFVIDDINYDPTQITLFKFLELVDAGT